MLTFLIVLGIAIYIFIGFIILIMDALTYGRLWPGIPALFIVLIWPVLIIYETIRLIIKANRN